MAIFAGAAVLNVIQKSLSLPVAHLQLLAVCLQEVLYDKQRLLQNEDA